MEIELIQVIDINGYLVRMGKKIKSDFVPRKGDFISDSAFGDAVHEVERLNVDLELQTCTAVLVTIKTTGNYTDETKKIEDKYGPHNWLRI